MRVFRRISLAAVLICLAGCVGGDLDHLDDQVAALIEQRQGVTLGSLASNDRDVVPETSVPLEPAEAAYREVPPTLNPHPADLPAKSASGHVRLEEDAPLPPMLDSVEESVSLDLEEVMAWAIAHARQYRNEKEELFLAALTLLAERHLFSARLFNKTIVEVAGTPEAGDHDHALELINDLGVTQRLPYGGQITAGALVNVVNVLRSSSTSTVDDLQNTELLISATLPLLRGAGQVVREDLIQAERDLIYATRAFERFRREFLVDVARAYFDLLRQQAVMKNLANQIQSLERLAQQFKALADAGRSPYFEYQRSQQSVLFARNNLLNTQEAYATALDAFKIRIGMPVEQALVIEAMHIQVPEMLLDMPDSIAAARKYRLDLQTSRDQIDDARRGVNNTRNDLLPDLETFAILTVPTDPDKDRGGLDLDAGAGAYRVGMELDAPLDRRIEGLNYRSARIELERAHRAFGLFEDQVALAVRRAIREIQQANFSLQLQQQNVALSERRIIEVKLRERTLGPRDVIEAQNDLLDAENRRDSALRDQRVSVLEYLLQSGQIRVSSDGHWMPPAKLVVPGRDSHDEATHSKESDLKGSLGLSQADDWNSSELGPIGERPVRNGVVSTR